VGLGGVGKTQLTTEYCYRQYGSTYGLVMWLRAEQAESVEGDMRRLCNDLCGTSIKGMSTQEVRYQPSST
jgi:GTPase SAR1 family protein